VTLSYKTWPDVDIVPVSRSTNSAGDVTHYNVPDANTDTWIMSRPKALAAAIEEKSSTCGTNFRRIIKMMKHWSRIHSDYLTSYHIEVLALSVFDQDLDNTSWQVHQFFDKARNLLQSSLWYDLGFVDGYLSGSDRAQVLKRFDAATTKSLTAWYKTYDKNDDHKGAIELWRQIFGDKFPAYG
jgi:hypothetical protein